MTGVAGPNVVRPLECARFESLSRGKHTVFQSAGLLVGVDAFEAGQSHQAHVHADQEKVWQVLAGSGTVEIGGVRAPITAGELVVIPAGVSHGLHADGGERMVVLVTLAPGPVRA